MEEYKEHWHCDICGKCYYSEADTQACFESHEEINYLRHIVGSMYGWVSYEGHGVSKREHKKRLKHFAKATNCPNYYMRIMKYVCDKYSISLDGE